MGENPSFPEFYSKLKSSFKFIAKMQVINVLEIYQAIIKASLKNICDKDGLQTVCQTYIPSHKKAEWICTMYDK